MFFYIYIYIYLETSAWFLDGWFLMNQGRYVAITTVKFLIIIVEGQSLLPFLSHIYLRKLDLLMKDNQE